MRCYNAAMREPFQFSLRRLFAAMTLIAVGVAAVADFKTAVINAPPLSLFSVMEGFACLPLVGAGILTPAKRPILGACLGLLCFPIFLWWLMVITDAMSV